MESKSKQDIKTQKIAEKLVAVHEPQV